MSFLSAVVTLLLVMDPLGNVPMFLTALRGTKPERRVKVIIRESLIALGIILVFLFLGKGMLNVIHVTSEALTVAGGVILLLIAIRMIFPTEEKNLHENTVGEPLIVPLAVPYVAGPSLLATLILFVSSSPTSMLPFWLGATVTAWLLSTLTLVSAGWLQRFVGERALTALERLMGMILVIISTQMVLSGIAAFFHMA